MRAGKFQLNDIIKYVIPAMHYKMRLILHFCIYIFLMKQFFMLLLSIDVHHTRS